MQNSFSTDRISRLGASALYVVAGSEFELSEMSRLPVLVIGDEMSSRVQLGHDTSQVMAGGLRPLSFQIRNRSPT